MFFYYDLYYVLSVVSVALLLDGLIGDPRFLYSYISHPVAVIGRGLEFSEKCFLRERDRSRVAFLKGAFGLFCVIAFFVGLVSLLFFVEIWLRFIIESVLLSVFLAQRSLYEHVCSVSLALARGDLAGARGALRHLVSRDVSRLDEHAVARGAIESLSENLSDSVLSPLFWFFLGGLPGLVFYKVVNTADSMWGYRSARYEFFGKSAARLDDVVNYGAARLSVVLIAVAAIFASKHSAVGAVAMSLREAHKHSSPNAGWPEGAFAGALNISLGGERYYADVGVKGTWIGTGRDSVSAGDIELALLLYKRTLYVLFSVVILSLFSVVILWR